MNAVWLVLALPLAGFAFNGALSLWKRPVKWARSAVTAVGVGVLAAAFLVAVRVVLAVAAGHPEEPYLLEGWSWMPSSWLATSVPKPQADESTLQRPNDGLRKRPSGRTRPQPRTTARPQPNGKAPQRPNGIISGWRP